MIKVPVYNREGIKTEELKLSEEVFVLEENNSLLHQVYTVLSGNRRINLADTKNRGERSGSGRKPWKQKGTGNARVGSIRNPIWRKGGIVFGPTSERNYKRSIPKKMNQKAIKLVLGTKANSGELIVLEDLNFEDKKTKFFQKMLNVLNLKKKILVGLTTDEKSVEKMSRNIAKVNNIMTARLNVFDMLNTKYLLLSKESIVYLEKKYGK